MSCRIVSIVFENNAGANATLKGNQVYSVSVDGDKLLVNFNWQ